MSQAKDEFENFIQDFELYLKPTVNKNPLLVIV